MSASKKLNSPHRRGFLLFELMVTVIVLSISLTVISRSFITSLFALQTSSHFFKGGLLLERKMWEIEEEASFSPGKEGGTFEEFGGIFHWTVEIEELEFAPLYEALVTVDWDMGGRKKALTVTTYLSKPHEE